MFTQFRPRSIEVSSRRLKFSLTEKQKFTLNLILFDAFDLDERLEMGQQGRRLMLPIMYDVIIDLQKRINQTLPLKTVTKIIYRNKDILYDALNKDMETEGFYGSISLRPRHKSKKERISPPNS